MSVFTPVTDADLAAWLKNYAIGRLDSLQGISAGVQNSNFFVTTSLGRYVLTLFETMPRAELPFYLHLMAHLARHGLPVPAPSPTGTTNTWAPCRASRRCWSAGSPAAPRWRRTRPTARASARCWPGCTWPACPSAASRPTPRAEWRRDCAARVRAHLPADEQAELDAELAFQAGFDLKALPQGVIHADLFRDNVLWDGDFVGGVIDFYFAGHDALLFDVAVTVNDWCAAPTAASTRPAAPPCWRPMPNPAPSPRASRPPGRPCCAPPRCASGFRGWKTSTCRGPARWCW
jgi:homoserine kinase type II